MLDICNDEITSSGLHFNASKSVIMRVGLRWNTYCTGFDFGSLRLKFVDSLRYLDIYLKAGKILVFLRACKV